MYRLHAWFDFFLTIVYCTVWIAFAIWIPWNKKHHYDFGEHDDQFRLSLFVIGICFAIFFPTVLIRKIEHFAKFHLAGNVIIIASLITITALSNFENF